MYDGNWLITSFMLKLKLAAMDALDCGDIDTTTTYNHVV